MKYEDAVEYINIYKQENDIAKLLEFYKKEGVGNKQIAEACEKEIKLLLDMCLNERPVKKSFLTHIKPEKLVTEIITSRGQFTLTKSKEENSMNRKKALAPFFTISTNPHSSADEYINDLLEKAFDENYHVKSIQALKDLTILMRIVENKSTYPVCLALIVEATNPKILNGKAELDKELNYSDSLNALSLLNQLLAENQLRNYQCNSRVFQESSLQQIIASRYLFFQKFQESQLLITEPIALEDEPVKDKGRSSTIRINHENKKLLGKQLPQETHTQLEAVANELFRLIVGSAQPKTYLARVPETTISEVNPYMTVCELAEEYTPINSLQIEGNPMEIICSSEILMSDLARITASSLLLAENDMHGGNIGFCQYNGELRLVKIDGDEALYPLTKRGEKELLPKLIAQDGKIIPIEGVQSIDCFSLNRSDLEQLPAIRNPANGDDKDPDQNPSEHFLPFNWAFRTSEESDLNKIQNNPNFKQNKDIAVIKFLMIPRQVFCKLADKFISKPELKREFLEWAINRQYECYEKMFLSSEECINLYKNYNVRAILEKEIQEFILEMKQDGYEYTENINLNNTILNEHDILHDQQYELDKRLGKEPDIESIGNIRSLDCDEIENLLQFSELDCALSAEKTQAHEESLNARRAKQALYKSIMGDLHSGEEEEHNLQDAIKMNP